MTNQKIKTMRQLIYTILKDQQYRITIAAKIMPMREFALWGSHVSQKHYQVDQQHLEPGHRLYQDQRRL